MPVQTIEVTEPHNVLLFICEVHPEETSRDANDFVQLMQLDPNMPFSEPKLFRHWNCVSEWAIQQA